MIALDLDQLHLKIIDAERDLFEMETKEDNDPTVVTGTVNYMNNYRGRGNGNGFGNNRGTRGRGKFKPWLTKFNKQNGWTEASWTAMYRGIPPKTEAERQAKRRLRTPNHVPGSTWGTCSECRRVGHYAVDHDLMMKDNGKLAKQYETVVTRQMNNKNNNRGRRGFGRGGYRNLNRNGRNGFGNAMITENEGNMNSNVVSNNQSMALRNETNNNNKSDWTVNGSNVES